MVKKSYTSQCLGQACCPSPCFTNWSGKRKHHLSDLARNVPSLRRTGNLGKEAGCCIAARFAGKAAPC